MSAATAIGYLGRTASALLLAAASWFGGGASAADPLGHFPVNSGQVSVSRSAPARSWPTNYTLPIQRVSWARASSLADCMAVPLTA